jgi:clorobiocin biosynthesis protein CloN7
MPDSDPTTHMLDVPGARLYYERRGSGSLLLMIGSPASPHSPVRSPMTTPS